MDSGSLLSAGRALFQGITKYGRIGLSANSRQALESFYNNGSALFNQLYVSSENKEVYNTIAIKALRAKNQALVNEELKAAASKTNGTQIDTKA